MDDARSLRGDAEGKVARQEQASRDAIDADRDNERSRSEAADSAAEAASQRQEADALEAPTDGLDYSDEKAVLRGRADDNDLRERNAIQAAEASKVRAQQLRDEATGYGDDASTLRSDADAAEAKSLEDEHERRKADEEIIAAEIITQLDKE
jgi:hypothetical protein